MRSFILCDKWLLQHLLHCSSIYINTMWSVLQQYLPALMSMPLPYVLLLRPPCHIYVPWRHTLNLCHICVHHEEPLSLDVTPNLSGAVHTGVEVRRMDSEISGLVERPWLQLMCCAICLPRGHNFRWRRGSPSGSEYWLVCCHWTPEIEFNKRLSLLIIRLANYSVTTSLIYKLIL